MNAKPGMRYCSLYNDPNNINSFGKWLAEQRKARMWTQSDLAEKVGVSQNSVSRWETGESFPSKANLQKIAELFDVTVQDIYTAITRPPSEEPESQRIAVSEAKPEAVGKPPEEIIRELETELSISRAENQMHQEMIKQLKSVLRGRSSIDYA